MIAFEVSGPWSHGSQKQLFELVENAFGETPAQVVSNNEPGPRVRGVAMEIAALVFSIPGAVSATWDLVERTRRLESVKRLISWARERRAQEGTRVLVQGPAGKLIPLEAASAEVLVEISGHSNAGVAVPTKS